MVHESGVVNHLSSVEVKIALFRSLFRGRDDVYPRRFESRKTGKSGYQPACANEWVRDLCEKPKVKCARCPHRRFLPVTDEVIRWHLSGQDDDGRDFVMGVYGRMMLDMRHTFACFQISSSVNRRSRSPSRRASSATSRPILLRYLKQSATVFATQ